MHLHLWLAKRLYNNKEFSYQTAAKTFLSEWQRYQTNGAQ